MCPSVHITFRNQHMNTFVGQHFSRLPPSVRFFLPLLPELAPMYYFPQILKCPTLCLAHGMLDKRLGGGSTSTSGSRVSTWNRAGVPGKLAGARSCSPNQGLLLCSEQSSSPKKHSHEGQYYVLERPLGQAWHLHSARRALPVVLEMASVD